MNKPKLCCGCRVMFTKKRISKRQYKHVRFCSLSCYRKWKRPKSEKNCEKCGKLFKTGTTIGLRTWNCGHRGIRLASG